MKIWPRHSWEGNIRMDHTEIRWEDVDWIHLAQDIVQWRHYCEHGNEPWGSMKNGNFLTSLATISS